jgi:hypothetical protein
LFEKCSKKAPTSGSKIAKMLFGTQKTWRFSMFLPHFSKKFFKRGFFDSFKGLRYLRVGGRGFCSGTEKTRSEENARKCRTPPKAAVPHIICAPQNILRARLRLAFSHKK